jgi:oligopeptide transport system permease protein
LKYRDLSVGTLIAQGLPVSLTLGGAALLFALAVGLPLGTWAALRRRSAFDHGIMGFTVLGVVLPSFVTGPLLVLIFGVWLRWLPVAGWQDGDPYYLILPVVTLAMPLVAYIARLIRSSLIEVLQSDFIRAARARGLGERTRHLAPCAAAGAAAGGELLRARRGLLVTGSLVVETVFGLPGTDAISSRARSTATTRSSWAWSWFTASLRSCAISPPTSSMAA